MDQIARPQFYDGEYLGAVDLAAVVRYARESQARHGLGAHLWGIALGLDLIERVLPGDDVEMVLAPGIAWDGFARPVTALSPQRLGLELFADFKDDTPPTGVPVEVWLNYRELPAKPLGVGFSCPDDVLFGRVIEGYTFEVRRTPVTDYHSVTISSRAIEAKNALNVFDATRPVLYDESVPQQTFPEQGDRQRWPVFVGIVRWRKDLGQPGRLIKRTDDDRNNARRGRHYLGAVAETIVAPDGVLRLRDRGKDPADPMLNYRPPVVAAPAGTNVVNDLVWCEGHLRVVGDTRLQDGLLDYRVAQGGNDGVPIYLRRTASAVPVKKTTLDAFVSAPPSPPPPAPQTTDLTRFTVSTADSGGANARECLTVVTQRAGIKQAEVGINAAEPTNTLHVNGPTGIRYGLAYVTGDAAAAWSGFAFNAYSPPGGPWVFPDPAHKPAALILNDAGGVPQIQFQTSFSGNPAAWNVHMTIKGDSGNVGVGTVAPNAKLHLHSTNAAQGDLRLFSASADFEYDGGTDKLFVFKDSANGKTAFLGGDIGIGTAAPLSRLHVAQNAHLNVVLELSDVQEHLTAVVGSVGSGLRFSNTNDFFIASQSYANRADTTFGNVHLRVRPDGNVGIGNNAPQTRLHVTGNRIRLGDNNKRLDLRVDGSQVDLHTETHHLYIRTLGDAAHPGRRHIIMNPAVAEGNVGIGTTDPQSKLHVAGNMQLNGDAFVSNGFIWLDSDARLKQKVEPISKPLDRLLALKGVSYEWRESAERGSGPERDLGFLAQDVEGVFPEWVKTTPSGSKAVNMSGMSALLVESVRALAERCEKLESEVRKLKKQVEKKGEDTKSPPKSE